AGSAASVRRRRAPQPHRLRRARRCHSDARGDAPPLALLARCWPQRRCGRTVGGDSWILGVLRADHETIKITQRQERLYMQDIVLVYTTWPDATAAEQAGRALVEARLAACANILPGMVSLYHWEGTLQRAQEAVMILKTRRDLARSLT